LYASWTRVSSGTSQKYLSNGITVQLIDGCARVWWTWRLYLCCLMSTTSHSDVLMFLIVPESHICGLMMAWYDILVCTILYIFKRSQLGPEAASWISCQYTGILHSYHSRAPLMYLGSGHLLL
jgi:hypothetical protein